MAGVFTWKGIKGLRDFKSSVWRIARQREREREREREGEAQSGGNKWN